MSVFYRQCRMGWHFRKLFQSSELKAPSSNVSFHWNVVKETFELWALSFETAFDNVTPRGVGCTVFCCMSALDPTSVSGLKTKQMSFCLFCLVCDLTLSRRHSKTREMSVLSWLRVKDTLGLRVKDTLWLRVKDTHDRLDCLVLSRSVFDSKTRQMSCVWDVWQSLSCLWLWVKDTRRQNRRLSWSDKTDKTAVSLTLS